MFFSSHKSLVLDEEILAIYASIEGAKITNSQININEKKEKLKTLLPYVAGSAEFAHNTKQQLESLITAYVKNDENSRRKAVSQLSGGSRQSGGMYSQNSSFQNFSASDSSYEIINTSEQKNTGSVTSQGSWGIINSSEREEEKFDSDSKVPVSEGISSTVLSFFAQSNPNAQKSHPECEIIGASESNKTVGGKQ